MKKLAICCLWQGDASIPAFSRNQYTWRYVEALKRGLHTHATDVQLTCCADATHADQVIANCPGVKVFRFDQDDIGGWAAMLQAFHPIVGPDPGQRAALFNLDLIITGALDWLWEWDLAPVGLHRDPFYPKEVANAVCTFSYEGGGLVWEDYMSCDPQANQSMGTFSEMVLFRRLQSRFSWPLLENHPHKLLSYKQHLRKEGRSFDESSIVYFHGKPKPHQLPEDHELAKIWRNQP